MKNKTLILILILIFSLACSLVEGTQEPTATTAPVTENSAAPSAQSQPAVQPAVQEEIYYLFAPKDSTSTYLIDANGIAYHAWESQYHPGDSVYLLDNGHLLRTGQVEEGVDIGGAGGVVEEIAPDGTVIWSYRYANENGQLHHDIELLPNGNILMIAWERKSQAESISAGRDPALINQGVVWSDSLLEIDSKTNEIVWEWHVWDHLIQDFDETKENYGAVAEYPKRIDLNYPPRLSKGDWIHLNSVDYNAELDQILLSSHSFSEVWIIDHGTTTAEAKGAKGDLLYRWGNPQAYGAGTGKDQQFFSQHDAQWIGLPGERHILVFNNGDKEKRPYSTIDEIIPSLNADGSYTLLPSGVYAPESPVWNFTANPPKSFYADHISGVERLASGNTLICDGIAGIFFEVTPAGEEVWRYVYGGQTFRVTQVTSEMPGVKALNLQAGEIIKSQGKKPQQGDASNNPNPREKAVEACAGLSVGTACTLNPPNKEPIHGVCQSKQNQFLCVPNK